MPSFYSCIKLVLAALITTAATVPTKDAAATTLNWTNCTSPWPKHFQCSTLQAPLYYTQPNGKTIDLKVVKIPAKNTSERIGSWIFQQGGPGLPTAIPFINLDNKIGWRKLQQQFDIVVLDPRGVGINYPIKCDPELYNKLDETLGPYPETEHDWEHYHDVYGTLGKSCQELTQKAYGPDIWSTVDTLTSARDLETLRVALNEGGINYYGLSWGSQRGHQYAQQFPHNIRTMILDGVVDHTLPLDVTGPIGNVAVSKSLDVFYEWASTNKSSAMYGKDTKSRFLDLLRQVEENPVRSEECAQSGKCLPTITKRQMTNSLQSADEDVGNYPFMAKAIADAIEGNFTSFSYPTLTEDTDTQYSYMLGCMDFYTNETYQQWADRKQAQTTLVGFDYNGITMADTRFLQCPKWPAKVVNPPQPLPIDSTSAPILLVNSLFDPATPYVGAVNIQRQIAGSVLLTRKGANHGSLYVVKEGEAQDLMIEYAITGKPPAPGTVVDT